MKSEAEFIAAIAAEPEDNLPRLVFADWLEENGLTERAELIRLACQFDPHRDRFDDDGINALRQRVAALRRPDDEADLAWRKSLYEPMGWGVNVEWRRGFVDALELPVQWFLAHGEQFRARYPLLRKLVIFRLNGWGERLAACPWLRGIREIELACWYADADALAVANSPHLGDVERVVLWSGGSLEQARLFARGSAWPHLGELHLVSRAGAQEEWVWAVDEAAGRPIATVYDFGSELFPFAADFGDHVGFFVGKLPDGTQLFAYGPEWYPTAEGWLFQPDGTRREPFRFEFPPELVLPRETGPIDDWNSLFSREARMRAARKAHLGERIGFVRAFIRVEGIEETARYRGEIEEIWGGADDPAVSPEQGDWPGGHGGQVYAAVRSGEYAFDFGNEWLCDRTGHVTFT
jgi:uncharacterized protein (TIGR02996 family)